MCFTAYQNDDLPGAPVVLSGAIGDFGEAVSVLPNGTVDPEHSNQFNLALTQGSFRIVIGRSVEVLLRVYAKCLDGGDGVANERIAAALSSA